MATFGLGIPSLPDERRISNGLPVFGVDAAAFAEVQNHLHGYRWRALASMTIEPDASVANLPALGGGYPPGPVDDSVTHRMFLRVSPSARWLWLSMDYQAWDESTTEPTLDVELQDLAGTVFDTGVRWRRAEGTLPGAVHDADPLLGPVYPVMTCTTGGRIPSEADLTALGAPRLISLEGLPAGGSRAQLVFTANRCRLLSVTAWEWAGTEV